MKLQYKIMLFMTCILITTLGIVCTFSYYKIEKNTREQIGRNVLNTAATISNIQDIQEAIGEPNGDVKIQGIVERIRLKTRVQFITVMDMNGIRYSHPLPEKIGQRFSGGDEGKCLNEGQTYTTEGEGSLGISLRAFTPIYRDGTQVGAVCVGVLTGDLRKEFLFILKGFIPYIYIGLLIGIIGSVFLAYNIKRTIFGLEPNEIAWILEEREAILEGMNEGLIAVNNEGQIVVINKYARKILNLGKENMGSSIYKHPFGDYFSKILKDGQIINSVEQKIFRNLTVMSSYSPVLNNEGEVKGALVTFQDLTKVKQMAEELTGIKEMAWNLRAQNHEFMNKLHTISGLIQLEEYDKAIEFIHDTSNVRNEMLGILNNNIRNVSLAGLLLSKYNKASEAKIKFIIDSACYIDKLPDHIREDNLICIIGNLIENSIDAVLGKQDGSIQFLIKQVENKINIVISNNGDPISEELKYKIYDRGVSTKEGIRGFGLNNIKRIVDSLHGQIDFTTGDVTTWYINI